MCILKKVTGIDPGIAQSREGPRRFYKDGPRPRQRFGGGDYRDIRCHQCDLSRARTLEHQEASPLGPVRQDRSPDFDPGTQLAHKVHTNPFGFRIPFTKDAVGFNQSHWTHTQRCREKAQSHTRFDIPDEIMYEYKFPHQPASLVIRSASPRAADINVPSNRRRLSIDALVSDPRAKELSQPSQQSRQRPVIAERSAFRRHPDRAITVARDNYTAVDSSRDNNRQRRSGSQYGGFPDEIRREKVAKMLRDLDEKRQRSYEDNRRKSHSCNFFVRDPGDAHEIVEDEINNQQRLAARSSGLRPPAPGNDMARNVPRNRIPSSESLYRPQIIQDGCRQISDTGAHIYMEDRVQQNHETFRHNFRSLAYRRPRSQRSNYFQAFDSGGQRIVHSKHH
ncbi:hypothetical protein PHISCL_07293 [Aspergillus sclerotialis]|uniref:Uncharacterized protein n=1 Tax=Aspergillus sclerotialis TaxID=2070753 RepID=A0A3A2ZBS4_9EURO|nr:hypothetical protein PHISCL_07293 [Aspergillus sclerotialis]